MATTEQRNQNRTRPTKSNAARNKRRKAQKNRLIALGMDEATVNTMNPREILTKLKRPAKVAKEFGTKNA